MKASIQTRRWEKLKKKGPNLKDKWRNMIWLVVVIIKVGPPSLPNWFLLLSGPCGTLETTATLLWWTFWSVTWPVCRSAFSLEQGKRKHPRYCAGIWIRDLCDAGKCLRPLHRRRLALSLFIFSVLPPSELPAFLDFWPVSLKGLLPCITLSSTHPCSLSYHVTFNVFHYWCELVWQTLSLQLLL